jgi:hypothetical protein
MNSSEAGRPIDVNDEQSERAFDSIRASFGLYSNVNEESELQDEKPCPKLQLSQKGKVIAMTNNEKVHWTQFE